MADNQVRIVWFQFAQMTVVYPHNKDVGCMCMMSSLVKLPDYPKEIISWGKRLLPMVLTLCHTVNICILSNLMCWARYSSNFRWNISKVGCCKVNFSGKLEELWNFGKYNFGFFENKQNKDLNIKILFKFHFLTKTGCCIKAASRESYVKILFILNFLLWCILNYSSSNEFFSL